jgi:hypothetical protein
MLTDHKADNTSNLFIGKYVIFCCSSKEFPNRIPIYSNDSFFVTTHVVRLKLFRLKAEGVRKERLPHLAEKQQISASNMASKFALFSLFLTVFSL